MFSRIAWALMLILSAGCGSSGPKTVTVEGTVTYQGKPIEKGDISFHPDATSNGFPSSGMIVQGAYRLTGKSGLLPGSYNVRINAYRPDPNPIKSHMPSNSEPTIQFLPAKFNAKSRIEKLVIEPDANRVSKDFDLL